MQCTTLQYRNVEGPTPMQCAVREGGHEVHMEAHCDRVGALQCD